MVTGIPHTGVTEMPRLPRLRRTLVGVTIAGLAATVGLTASTSTATSPNPITPGNMVGYGFDQCEAPSQAAMTAWLQYSPFRAVGIYMSGALRFCQAQTNLTPTWVATQLATGWRLLPIHLGAQASCTTRDRYQKTRSVPTRPTTTPQARAQGTRRGQARRGGGPAARHRRAEHHLLRPRGVQRGHRLVQVVLAVVPAAHGPTGCTSSATSPGSTPAPRRASRSSTTPG